MSGPARKVTPPSHARRCRHQHGGGAARHDPAGPRVGHPRFRRGRKGPLRLALGQELLLRPMGNTVYFMPPYVVRDEELEMLAGRALEIVEQLG